jgi:NADPH2:quinone reductase
MFCMAAQSMGYRVCVLDPAADSPAGAVADRHLCANYDDPAALADIARTCAAATTEFENVPAQALLALAEHMHVAPSAQAVAIAQDRVAEKTFLQAAGLPETFFTVWSNLFDRGRLQSGETVLIQGGSSGIGVTAIQMAKAFGATVIVTAGSDAKCAACLALGADQAINYKTQDFETEVLRLTEGRGVNVVLDMVAGAYVAKEINCLAEDGRLVIIAVQGGVQSELNAGLVMRKRLTVTGSTLRVRPVSFKAAIAQSLLKNVWPLLAKGTIKPVVSEVFAARDAGKAHAAMEASAHVGKIILDWSRP